MNELGGRANRLTEEDKAEAEKKQKQKLRDNTGDDGYRSTCSARISKPSTH